MTTRAMIFLAVCATTIAACGVPRDAADTLAHVRHGALRVAVVRVAWSRAASVRLHARAIGITFLVTASALTLIGAWLFVDAALKRLKREQPPRSGSSSASATGRATLAPPRASRSA